MTAISNRVMDDVEYFVITPFEFIFRKIGKIIVFILWACAVFFGYSVFKGLVREGFDYETRMYLAYMVMCIMVAGTTNLITTWLSSRRVELSQALDLEFQNKWALRRPVSGTVVRDTPDYSRPCTISNPPQNNNNTNTTTNTNTNTNSNTNTTQNTNNANANAVPNSEYMIEGKKGFEDSEKRLEELIGLGSVKEQVLKLKLKLELEKKQELQGRKKKSSYNMHMFFTGNPGTGKTTVARIITGILYNMGYIKENKCVEVGKQDIVGQYLGQSAQKADAVIKSALGGVLFIDEAYSLCEKYQNDGFAKETVEIILKAMEDHKDDLIIIFAGYTKEMKQFKEMNPGLKSRIGLTIEFPDYTPDELTEIFVKKAEDCGYTVPEESERKIHYLCSMASMEKDFGNGRFVDNLFREVEINHALTTKDINAYDKRIMTILPEDVTDDILDKVL